MIDLYRKFEAGLDSAWVLKVLEEMVLIRSENPFHECAREGYREKEMAEYLAERMSSLGLHIELEEVRPSRPNVFGSLGGAEGRFTLMLAGHMDTARTDGYPDAYEVEFEDGKVYGRGACDMKAALAAYLLVAKVLMESGMRLKGNLIICGTVDEEFQMLGSKAIGMGPPKADQGIIGEPTSLQICPSNKGRVSAKIITRGQAAHSSVPEKGVNAIARMAKIVEAFEDYNDELMRRVPHPLCGHGRFTPGVIHGGVQVNMVPDYCELEVDRRTLPGETEEKVYEEFHRRIDRVKAAVPGLAYEITEPTWLVAPNDISAQEPVVFALRNAHQAILNHDPEIQAFMAASDAPYMGFPTVVCGPGNIAQAHSTCEFVDLEQVVAAARLYLHVVLELLG
jgi:acetylornithine deacetylase